MHQSLVSAVRMKVTSQLSETTSRIPMAKTQNTSSGTQNVTSVDWNEVSFVASGTRDKDHESPSAAERLKLVDGFETGARPKTL